MIPAIKHNKRITTHPNKRVEALNTTAAANYSHNMRDRLNIIYESYDGISKIYAVECPCECNRTVESVKNVLGHIVNIHRRDYTITELVIRGNPNRVYYKGDLIEFKVKPFMANCQ